MKNKNNIKKSFKPSCENYSPIVSTPKNFRVFGVFAYDYDTGLSAFVDIAPSEEDAQNIAEKFSRKCSFVSGVSVQAVFVAPLEIPRQYFD